VATRDSSALQSLFVLPEQLSVSDKNDHLRYFSGGIKLHHGISIAILWECREH